MAHTIPDFLRTWHVSQCFGLMAAYVNTNNTITFAIDTPPNSIRCTTSGGYSKLSAIDWADTHFTAVTDPFNPPNIMLRSNAANSSEGGVDGHDVKFRIVTEPNGAPGAILALISGPDGSGAWNGGED